MEQVRDVALVGESLAKQRTVISLEEDEFSKNLTDIIRRDFFPDVKKLEAQTEPCNSSVESTADFEEGSKDGTSMRLDHFLNTYESEDDASFKEMVIKSNEIQHQKHAWLHEKEKEYAKLAPEEELAITGNTGESYRQAGLDSWAYTAKNSLMYIPDGVENSTVETVQGASRKREIVHSNTRLPHLFVQKFQHAENSDCIKKPRQDKIGVDGKTLPVEGSPKVNGYGFLATPTINPGVDASPLMTWGSIEGTPVKIDSDYTIPGPSFKMPKIPVREKVALKLADQVAKASRDRKKISASPLVRDKTGMTPSKTDRLRLLSPAARKLIDTRIKSSDQALSASYSPQLSTGNVVRTPNIGSTLSTPTPSQVHCTTSLTDNLLHLIKK